MKIVAIIPARGGSKGIPKKNIVRVGGKPLIAWTIASARRSRLIGRVVVSSDDPVILSVAARYGAETVTRPKRYAGSRTPAAAAVLHALDHLKKAEGYVPDVVVLLQPTSPLRTAADIDGAIRLLMRKRGDAVIGVAEGDNKFLKSFFIEHGVLRGIVNDAFPFANRQDLPKTYMPNGALYVIREKAFRKSGKLFAKRTLGFVMEKERSIDLDSREDIPVIEAAFRKTKTSRRHRRK